MIIGKTIRHKCEIEHKTIIPYIFVVLFIALPFSSFFNMDWVKDFGNMDWVLITESLKVSAITSVISTCIIGLIGTPAAYFMARYDFKGKNIMDTIISLPMVLPPAVTGLMLLMAFGRNGIIGRWIYQMGLQLTFSKVAVILTFVFIGLPVFMNTMKDGFNSVDRKLEFTARTLGDTPRQVFFRITFPLTKQQLKTGLILAWAKGVGEFGATMMFAGNIRGITQTLPLAIYSSMESNMNVAMFLSCLMIFISIIVIRLTRGRDKDV